MRQCLLSLALGAAALLLFLAGPAAAMTVYKWTDDQGVVHYGDAPPPGVEAERLELKGSRTRPSPDKEEGKDQAEEDKAPEAADVNITQAEIQVRKLEKRVEQARKVYEQARQNRVEGEKVRLGSEQNYVRYLERIENLKAEEEQARKRLEDLRGQLEKARSRLEKLREKQAQEE
jgi:chromosome segregation ATPase